MGSDSTLNPDIINNTYFYSKSEFKVFGASVQGVSHRKSNRSCEDAYAFRYAGVYLIIAVADGVSSVNNGGKGAEIAVNGAVDACSEMIRKGETQGELLISEGISAGRKAILDHAYLEGMPLSSYATTLLLVCISENKVFCGHIGDGAVICVKNEDIHILSEPVRCEYANETTVLTGSDWKCALRRSSGECDVVILVTDGCQNALLRRKNAQFFPYNPFILPLVRSLPDYVRKGEDVNQAISDLLFSEKMQALSSDDMTLVIAFKSPGETK